MKKITDVVVLGGGTAGLISAITLRKHCPELSIKLIRSKAIGVIGVGEGTLGSFNPFFFDYLGLDRGEFYRQVNPSWKLGIKFRWGRRGAFNYAFSPNCDWQWDDLAYPNGFYCQDNFLHTCQYSSLMDVDMAFVKKPNGDPLILNDAVFHLENTRFVDYLESQAEALGIPLIDKKVSSATCSERGVSSFLLEDGNTLEADLFIDASGFKSVLLHQHLNIPFQSFESSLFCDRALIGTWKRTTEAIRPYTTSDTMNAGWSWRIDHESHINRGYVYSSSFLSRDAAETEFRTENPLLGDLHEIKFTPGKYARSWEKNVVAIGNASGFVEPLEATSIGIICAQSKKLVDALKASQGAPNQMIRDLYNHYVDTQWEATRRFLTLHYKLNTLLDNSFWQTCNSETVTGDLISEMLQFYETYGPDNRLMRAFLPESDPFGIDGYLTIMVGMKHPYPTAASVYSHPPLSEADKVRWRTHQHYYREQAEQNALSAQEALAIIKSPDWEWYQ
ncbi:tryptophan-5-halogenase [Oleiphilus messinensis]|uniref:Tryptophan-5-halogenase n=1 Tax=Oleiphilus messinensis TaxID=141451 RepID=A0A1Y0IBD7_9GAMM|nr:tryptophan 7-halogenase [Oleiphilus messinensis]ARU57791.1 tryptophan-5-halogenase [Oleiphilus messinensis]